MKLVAWDYGQFEGTPREWKVEGILLGPVNLLVGSNASGKTRTLNVISVLAKLLAGDAKMTFLSGNYRATFDHDGKTLKYVVRVENSRVAEEKFQIDETLYLDRGEGGKGKIWAEKLGMHIDFQVPEKELAAVVRQDAIQHPFFEPLNTWGKSLYHYYFGSPLGKDFFGVLDPNKAGELNPRDPNQVIGIYRKGVKEFGDTFKNSIMADMAEIGYLVDDVGTKPPISLILQNLEEIIALYVQETGLGDVTDQVDMSQGMFRALSIIIQLNFLVQAKKPSCILVDDIGEGLDFERSCALIKLLMLKAQQSSVQLIMSTNDRFVMNTVPLEAWTVLRRVAGNIKVYNYANSKERFDEFKFTGMTNFDFFAFKFLEEPKNE